MSCFFRGKWNDLRNVRVKCRWLAARALRQSRWTRIISLFILSIALQACSSIRLGYNNGVELAVWWLDGYVDLDKVQARQLRDALRQLQLQHRQRVLPEYAQTLHQAQALAVHDITPEQVCAVDSTVRGYADEMLQSAEPAATALALSLTPAQINHLERKYAKTNAEYRSDWLTLSPDKMHEKRFDKSRERAEMVYGRLNAAQKKLIRQLVERSSFDPQQVQLERLRRQGDILQTLRQFDRDRPSSDEARNAVHGLRERALHSPQPGYREYAEALAQEDCQNVAAVHNSTTPKQRESAVRWLGGYESALRELAAQR